MRKTMEGTTPKKQAVTGFKVLTYQSKKAKDGCKLKLVLEAEVDGITAGEFDFGDVSKALAVHQESETEVGLSLFMEEEE